MQLTGGFKSFFPISSFINTIDGRENIFQHIQYLQIILYDKDGRLIGRIFQFIIRILRFFLITGFRFLFRFFGYQFFQTQSFRNLILDQMKIRFIITQHIFRKMLITHQQSNNESTAFSYLTLYTDTALMQLHNPFGYCQTDTGTQRKLRTLPVDLIETVEYLMNRLLRYTYSIIFHPYFYLILHLTDRNRDIAFYLCILKSIG